MTDLHARRHRVLAVLRVTADGVLWCSAALAAITAALVSIAINILGGLVFVIAVYGNYGPYTGVCMTLTLAGLALVALAAWAVRRHVRTATSIPRYGADSAHRGQR